jgi:quercetin dioxygenase-like cupin family protein
MTERPQTSYQPSVSHPADADYTGQGWRSFFRYRDLGVKGATGGDFDFRVVKARPGPTKTTGWHYHVLRAQVIYCLGGWEAIALEDGRVIKLVPGTCMNIPPGYAHNEIGYSADLEMLVVTDPAEVTTVPVDAPAGWDEHAVLGQLAAETSPERISGPWSWKSSAAVGGQVA